MIDLLTSRNMEIYLLVILIWPAALVAVAVLSHNRPPPAGEKLLRCPECLEATERQTAPFCGGEGVAPFYLTWDAPARPAAAFSRLFASYSAEYARRVEEAITRICI
jgi:hypothetical protein